jgi:hypothetical protein
MGSLWLFFIKVPEPFSVRALSLHQSPSCWEFWADHLNWPEPNPVFNHGKWRFSFSHFAELNIKHASTLSLKGNKPSNHEGFLNLKNGMEVQASWWNVFCANKGFYASFIFPLHYWHWQNINKWLRALFIWIYKLRKTFKLLRGLTNKSSYL